MPDIEVFEPTTHNAADPYHWIYDNLPLNNILARERLINAVTDQNEEVLRDAKGTEATLATRLSQSLEENGELKVTAIDDADHNIASHTDGSRFLSESEILLIDPTSIYGITDDAATEFVRMLDAERDKLALIADEATSFGLQVTISAISVVLLQNVTIELQNTSTIEWTFESPNLLKADTTFPATAAHIHYYNVTPTTSDRQNYSIPGYYSFMEGSLRVSINGIRILETETIMVPDSTVENWTATSFTSSYSEGTFAINRVLNNSDIVGIDFDIPYT